MFRAEIVPRARRARVLAKKNRKMMPRAIEKLPVELDAPTATRRQAAAAMLRAWAADAGDKLLIQAARLIEGASRGRRPCDDFDRLVEMRFLIDDGDASSPTDAARKIATAAAHEQSVEATTRRLVKKFNKIARRNETFRS